MRNWRQLNNFSRLNAHVLKAWASLLRQLPNSRLLLKSGRAADPWPLERIRVLFQEEGVPPSRLEILGRAEGAASHLSHYHRVDLALDTFPYNGVTTTCEALWMGVPVLTLRGDRHAAQYGASLLHQAGLREFIAENLDQYLELAARWAQDLRALADLRKGMRARLVGTPLLDADAFARDFETALRGLWVAWCRDPSRTSRYTFIKARYAFKKSAVPFSCTPYRMPG